jgi:MoxR-like ATPase
MARKISVNAVAAGIAAVAATPQNRSVCALIEALLVFKRMDVLGLERTIANADGVFNDLLLVLPEDENGLLYLRRGVDGRPFWGKRTLGARGTVWNTATRPTAAGLLFEPPLLRDPAPPHAPHPFRIDAISYIFDAQPANNQFVPIDALAAIVLRNESWDEAPTWDDLIDEVCIRFDLTLDELTLITSRAVLDAIDPFAGDPWEPGLLPTSLRPAPGGVRHVELVADRHRGGDAVSIPLRVDERTRRMIVLCILSTTAVLLVGPPGTGKTTLLAEIIEELRTNGEYAELFGNLDDPIWRTPDDSWTSREILGGPGVLPVSHDIRFVPGVIPMAIEEYRWVVLDEINRGDADRIFGALITWLSDRDVEIGQVSDNPDSKSVRLEWSNERDSSATTQALTDDDAPGDVVFRAGRSWRLLGTYNAQDAQRVFRFGQALGRRFQQVPIPAMTPDEFDAVLTELQGAEVLPASIDDRIASAYRAHYEQHDTRLGPAQFFKLRNYVSEGLSAFRDGVAEDDDWTARVPEGTIDELFAEAYLVTLGERLCRLDDGVREALRGRIVPETIPEDQWTWISGRLTDLT